LSPCPEGTRLEEANVHNRRCGSRRETYLRIEAPQSPRLKGGTSGLKIGGSLLSTEISVPGGHTPLFPLHPSGCSKFEVCGAYPSLSPGSQTPGSHPPPTPPRPHRGRFPVVWDPIRLSLLEGLLHPFFCRPPAPGICPPRRAGLVVNNRGIKKGHFSQ
jgi:hypothetical protein